jgi:hypothetical protein
MRSLLSALFALLLCGAALAQNGTGYPTGAIPVTTSATGTTAITAATLAGKSGMTTFICGFSILANGTANTGNAMVIGTVTGTMNFTQGTPASPSIGAIQQTFSPCIPASAISTNITIRSAAPGNSGIISVTGWGFLLPGQFPF